MRFSWHWRTTKQVTMTRPHPERKMRPMTCRHVAQPIPHGVAAQQSPATLRLRGKDSDLEQMPDTKPQIFSLQFDLYDKYCLILHSIPEASRFRTHWLKQYHVFSKERRQYKTILQFFIPMCFRILYVSLFR